MTQRLTAERFLFLQDSGSYAEGDKVKTMRLFSERLMEIWAGAHEEWYKAIEHQKGP